MMRNPFEEFKPQVVSLNISKGGIPKFPIEIAHVTFSGIEGDQHNHEKHNNPNQALSFQDIEVLEDLTKEGFPVSAGSTGENITVCNLHINHLQIGDVLTFSGGIVVELTKMRKSCYVLDAIDPRLKEVIDGRCGVYAKVLKEGTLRPGESLQISSSSHI